MTDKKKYDVVAIGNALLDVLCEVPETFLDQEGILKGVMNLVSRERSNNILKLVKPIKETAGGSAANTISTLAKLGLKTGYIGKIADDEKGRILMSERTPCMRPSNLAFGGENLEDIYITSLEGHLYRVKNTGLKGNPLP